MGRRKIRLHIGLSAQEMIVINLMAKGMTIPETANAMNLATCTINGYRSNVYSKLGAKNRVEAVLIALAYGIITNPYQEVQ